MCLDNNRGGLGIRNLIVLNMALLGKWGLRFASERDSLWRHVIARKFGEEGGGWTSVVLRKGYGVGFWKAIRKTWEVFKSNVCFIIGNERRIKFWLDKCGDTLLFLKTIP